MISNLIGRFFCWLRDAICRGLVRTGVRPNHLSVVGMLLTMGAGVAIALGRCHWQTWALGLMFGAGACDILDGRLAKMGGLETRFGGILDSVCDRMSDAALFFGMAIYYITTPDAAPGTAHPNMTLVLLALAGFVWAYLISYIKARAESAGVPAGGGFWQRPERCVTIFLGVGFLHLPTVLWILGLWPITTVLHRFWRVRRSCKALEAGQAREAVEAMQPRGLAAPFLWRWARGTWQFDIQAGATVLMLIFWDLPPIDPLRDLIARLLG